MVLSFVTVSAVLGSSAVRGLTSLFVGFFLGMIGVDLQTGQPRFTFGLTELLDGVDVIVVAVGLFAVGETLYVASRRYAGKRRDRAAEGLALHDGGGMGALLEGLAARRRSSASRSARMPAGGAEIPTFLSYALEKKLSKHKEEFGTTGAIEGVAGPEAANNASAAGVLVPMLTLGLPTSATAAIMLSAFQSYGINPGPLLLTTQAEPGLGPDRQPVHRQRHAGRAQPAADRALGAAAEDPGAAALCRHPGLRHRRHLRHLAIADRPRAALSARRASAS